MTLALRGSHIPLLFSGKENKGVFSIKNSAKSAKILNCLIGYNELVFVLILKYKYTSDVIY